MEEIRIPFAPPVYVRCVLDCLNSLGVKPSTVLSSAGLTWQDLRDGQHMMAFDDFRRFVVHAVHCSGEPDLGLIVGSMHQPYHTPVGMGFVTSETLDQGLQFLSRYSRLVFGGLEFKLENSSRTSVFTVRPNFPLCETHVFVVQTIFGAYCRLLEAVLGRPAEELVVGLPYPRPRGGEAACMRFVRRISFDHDCLSLELPSGLLATPSVSANAQAFSEAVQSCRKMESELIPGAFAQRVRHALLERLAGNPDAGELALDLGISPRTLVRRLAEVGMTYSEIKDDLRRTHATWYLQHTELSIEGIASQLGYADPTNFARKFKDWYRVAPSKMRQSMRVESS